MTDYGRVKSTQEPPAIEITPNYVYIADNIESQTEVNGDITETVYYYNYIQYTSSEYLVALSTENANLKSELLDTQTALCDVYELLEGGLD